MEKVLSVIFKNEADAYIASNKLRSLDWDYDISLGEIYVISKRENGEVLLKNKQGDDFEFTIGGAFIGGLIGLVGGPAGFLFGVSYGTLVGATGDLIKAGRLIPRGKTGLVAHIWEDWEMPVNSALEQFDATIERIYVEEEFEKEYQRELDEIDADITAKKENWHNAVGEAKDKAKSKLDELKEKREKMEASLKHKVDIQVKQIKKWLQDEKEKLAGINADIKDKMSHMSVDMKANLEKSKAGMQAHFDVAEKKLDETKEQIQARIDASKQKMEDTKEEVQVKFQQMKKEKLEKQIDKKEQRLEKLYAKLSSVIV